MENFQKRISRSSAGTIGRVIVRPELECPSFVNLVTLSCVSWPYNCPAQIILARGWVVAKELSGAVWVSRFPTSKETSSLVPDFRDNCDDFIGALHDAGATVEINATLRPPERAYLMHWSFVINTGEVEPDDVPPHAGVDIEWVHRKANGSPDFAASRAAAAAMVHGYDIVHRPALTSMHIFGKAIDMSISWNDTLLIKPKKSSTKKSIKSVPRSGLNPELWAVGSTYGVIKLPSDPPHWSSTGH